MFEKFDIEKIPCYLETHLKSNTTYYQKLGFQLIHSEEIPKSPITVYSMVREPRI